MLHALFFKGSLIKKKPYFIIFAQDENHCLAVRLRDFWSTPIGNPVTMLTLPQRYWECGHSSSNIHIWPCNHIECRQTIIYIYYPCKSSGSTCSILRPAGQKVSFQKRLSSWARLLKKASQTLRFPSCLLIKFLLQSFLRIFPRCLPGELSIQAQFLPFACFMCP